MASEIRQPRRRAGAARGQHGRRTARAGDGASPARVTGARAAAGAPGRSGAGRPRRSSRSPQPPLGTGTGTAPAKVRSLGGPGDTPQRVALRVQLEPLHLSSPRSRLDPPWEPEGGRSPGAAVGPVMRLVQPVVFTKSGNITKLRTTVLACDLFLPQASVPSSPLTVREVPVLSLDPQEEVVTPSPYRLWGPGPHCSGRPSTQRLRGAESRPPRDAGAHVCSAATSHPLPPPARARGRTASQGADTLTLCVLSFGLLPRLPSART